MSEKINLSDVQHNQQNSSIDLTENDATEADKGISDDFKEKSCIRPTASAVGLALYEDDTARNMPSISTYLTSLTIGAADSDDKGQSGSGHGNKGKLGTLFGVYLPSIQHILGVQMFLRLLWIVGIAGLTQSLTMVVMCCICTMLTSISISAIATNGVIDSGGAYFMISRNLGAEVGGATGILYYLANTVATAMYLVGGVEILLKYIAPGLPQFGDSHDHHDSQADFNNFRIYGTIFLLILFAVCSLGVRFVQFFAPISLACVILSIIAVFIGGFTAKPSNSPMICLLGNKLLQPQILQDMNGTFHCNKTLYSPLWHSYCSEGNSTHFSICDPYFDANDVKHVPGIPGFSGGVVSDNMWPSYLDAGEASSGEIGKIGMEITQDISTTFFVLLAIFFPSVTGIMTGANMSGDLKDPQKSIPIGTIAAQLTTSLIYLGLVVIYACTVNGHLLRDKY